MIVAEHQVNDGSDGNRIGTIFGGNHYRLFGDATNAQDGNLGLHDDRQPEDSTEASRIRNGEGAALHLFRTKLLGASALAQVGNSALQAKKVELLGIL